MLSNYFKIALRNLYRRKGYTFLNIAGLAFGMSCVILILLYIAEETSYDQFHVEAESIYRLEWHAENPQPRTPHPMAQAMVQEFPEVEGAVSLSPLWSSGLTRETFSIRNLERDLRFEEKNVLAVDTTFFDVFTFPMVKGDGKESLKKMGTLLISESMAQKYFGDEDPIGKFLAINSDTVFAQVSGVFKDVPDNSHVHFDFLVSYVLQKALEDPNSSYYEWEDFGHYNYVKLNPGADGKALEGKLLPWVANHLDLKQDQLEQIVASGASFKLKPITDIHLKSNIIWELENNGNIKYIYILLASAFLILFIASTNFINLTTARSAERAREIGIRKALGAYRKQLAGQFISESIIISMVSLILAGFLVELFLPSFSAITGSSLESGVLTSPKYILLLLSIGLLIGIISGLYPAVYLSSIQATRVLKGKFTSSKSGDFLRKGLVVGQFVISMILISTTLLVVNQLEFLRKKPLGFAQEGVIVLPIYSDYLQDNFKTLKNELSAVEGVEYVTALSNSPGTQFNQNPIHRADNEDITINAFHGFVEYDLKWTLDLQLVEGRFFSETDHYEQNYFVINETAAKQLQLEEPVGAELIYQDDDRNIRGTVVGVVADFNFQSLHQSIRPLILHHQPYYNYALVRIRLDKFEDQIAALETRWLAVDDNFSFEYSFLDENLESQYKSENQMSQVLIIFATIAVIIACLGLFGLAALNFHQRLKEVGVRKVLGASRFSLIMLLNGYFTKLVLYAIAIAIPVSYFLMDEWLDNFTYQVGMSPMPFVTGALILIGIAFITLTVLTMRASSVNPVDTLKEN